MTAKTKRRAHPVPSARSRAEPWWNRGSIILPAGLILALAVFAFVLYDSAYYPEGGSWVTQDDAYISYRYAQHALEGAGLVFNIGERVEGYTNFLWVLWLIVAGGLGFEFDLAAKVLGVASALGMILFAAFLGRGAWREFRPRDCHWGGVLAALLVASNSSLSYWAMSGLETAWFGLCVAASLWWWVRRSHLVILGLTLAALTRPEGGLVWVVLIGAEWLLGDGRRRALTLFAAVAALLAPFGMFKILYYGSLLPNPFYAKTGFSLEYLASGAEYLWLFLSQNGPGQYGLWVLFPALVLPALVLIGIRALPGRWRVLPIIWLVYTTYIVMVGGDVLRPHRFFVPIAVPMAVSVVAALGWLAMRLRRQRYQLALPIVAAVALAVWGWLIPRDLIAATRQLEIGLTSKMAYLARQLRTIDPTAFTLAASTIGRISYDLPGRRVIDMLGLTDTMIARHPESIPGNTSSWKERNYNAGYLLSQDPDYILFSTGHKPSAPAERALILHSKYRRNYHTILFPTPSRMLAVHKRTGNFTEPDSVWPSIQLAHDINTAFNLQLSGQLDSAYVVLQNLKKNGPGDFSLPDDFAGHVHMRQKRYDLALAYANAAIAVDSLSVISWQTKAQVYQIRGDTAGYREAEEHILRICPWMGK